MSDPVVQVEDLSFAYPDGTRALEGVSFEIPAGQRVGLAGPNGAGKSTLLLCLGGILHDGCAGAVRVLGTPVTQRHLPSIRRRIGLVFQNPDDQLFCPTVFEDVAFGPRNLKLGEDEVARRVGAALSAVGLDGFAERSSFHMSLGEKKRAAIATVLSMQPEILALDEPTGELDPRGRREILNLLGTLGGTQIIVTHDLSAIRRLCGRVIVLSRGRMAADGRPDDVFADESFLASHGLA